MSLSDTPSHTLGDAIMDAITKMVQSYIDFVLWLERVVRRITLG